MPPVRSSVDESVRRDGVIEAGLDGEGAVSIGLGLENRTVALHCANMVSTPTLGAAMSDEPNAFWNRIDRSEIHNLVQAGIVNMAALEPGKPREAPPLPRFWVDRDADLGRVGFHLDSGNPVPVVVTGPAGIGKSSLASMIAALLIERFPDGQLYVDLGTDDPLSAMRSALLRLGTPKEFISDTLGGMVSQYRTATSGKALLVIVDDAPDRETGTLFAPASETAAFLLIGHSWPDDLDVVRHELAELPAAHGTVLLAKILPELTEAEAAQYIADLNLSPARIRAIAGYIRTLLQAEAARPTERRVLTDYSTAELLTATRQMLTPSAAWLHRLLQHLPGPDLGADLLPAIGADAAAIIDELLDAQLMTRVGTERFRLEGRPDSDGLPIELSHAMHAVVAWYRRRAQLADHEVMGARLRLSGIGALDWSPQPRLLDADADAFAENQGLPWLSDNRRTLTGLVRLAAVAGWRDEAWALAEALWALFTNVPFPEEAAACYRAAADAAPGPVPKARMFICLGRVLIDLRAHEESEAVLDEAVALAREHGGEVGETLVCAAQEQLGWLYYRQERWDEAEATYGSALELAERLGRERSQALMLKLLGFVHRDRGAADAARRCFARALPKFKSLDDKRNLAVVRFELAVIAIAGGRGSEAADAERAITTMLERRLERTAAESMERLGVLLGGEDGRRWLEEALQQFDRFGGPEADRVRGLLGEGGVDG